MKDENRLREFIRSHVRELCEHFFPAGKKVRDEWQIGDTTGASGKSLKIALKGDKAGLWQDWATNEKGDFLKLLTHGGRPFPQAVEEIERAMGVSFELNGKEPKAKAKTAFDWNPYVGRVSDAKIEELAKWRGYSPEFCRWLKRNRLIGISHKDFWAFPVIKEDVAISCHYRINADEWRYFPKGNHTQPFVAGSIDQADKIFAGESQWDILAVLDRLGIHNGESIAGVASRGAKNAHLLRDLKGEIYLVPQNDGPGKEWLDDVARAIGRPVKILEIPSRYDDANVWLKVCPEPEALVEAIRKANTAGGYQSAAADRPAEQSDGPVFYAYPKPDPKIFHGLLGRIVKEIEPLSEVDPVALLVQILVGFGNACGRSAFFRVSADQHYTNMFACIVGKTAKARKGMSLSTARWVLSRIDPEWEESRVRSGLSSGEGLLWQIRDPIVRTEPIKEKGRYTGEYHQVIQDAGIEDKRLLVGETEFSMALVVMGRVGNTLSALIRDAFDSKKQLATMVKNSAAVATNPHISIIGHITKEELKTRMNECEVFNGFANRFLWICALRTRTIANPVELTDAAISDELEELASRRVLAKQIKEMERDEEASALWEQIYNEIAERETNPVIDAITDRGDSLTLRLSMLYALADGHRIIERQHVEAAYALWQYAHESAQYLFGETLGNPRAEKILAALKDNPNGLTKSEIQIGLFKKNLKLALLDEALDLLKGLNLITAEMEETGGRQAERFRYIVTKETK